MAWGCFVALLLVAASLGLGQYLHREPGLQYSYDCGLRGMQLLVFPRPSQTIHFKVLDEFGNRFEVNNCSICYHWVTSEPWEPAVFSVDYKGCHVLEKDGRFHLRVFVQALLPDGTVDVAQDVTLICPKPDHMGTPDHTGTPAHIKTQDPHLAPPIMPSTSMPHILTPYPVSAHTLTGSGYTIPSTLYPEQSFVHPTLASPSPSPGPGTTGPTLPHPQWGTLGHWEVTQPNSVGTHRPWEQCQVASGHFPCMVGNSSKEACQQAGCCYDHTREVPCYYGNTATIQCFRGGYFILVVSQEVALAHRVMLDNVHLAYAPTRCPPTQKTSTFVIFHVPLTFCGTTVQVVGKQLIYENQLVSDIDIQKGPQGSITRDSTFRLHVRCIFNTGDFLPIQASIFPPPPPAPVTHSGPLRLELRIAKDEIFSSYYQEDDYPLVRLLQEPVHVEVRLLQRTDPSLVLVLHQCWATPSANPFQQPQWPILSDGCTFKGDNYRTQMVAMDRVKQPFSSHYQRFTIATFTFLDSSSQRGLRGLVYFFCSASVCHPSGTETCSSVCGSRIERRRRSSGHDNSTARTLDIVSSLGAVGFKDSVELRPSGSGRNSSLRSMFWMLLTLLAITLVLGAGVFVSLSRAWARKLWQGVEHLQPGLHIAQRACLPSIHDNPAMGGKVVQKGVQHTAFLVMSKDRGL
ncbi:zona pellucida sperm-binding protein 1 isoform X1 [Nannospalax galili]|uniref:zona pellucida sperm-binding protein 1 isoform X1 n=1 Tax=Nannospalax galili TaxID=1026970 RepID=UPI00111C93BD|nr:zona pellucida sperm-binding protein 1 isoform X1 [Nannospalax galili]